MDSQKKKKNKQYGSEEISWIKKDENIKILAVFSALKQKYLTYRKTGQQNLKTSS